ncbi:hypothetical protein ACFL6T_06565 [Candidatus Zixiibacteriota bacterium]
MGKPSSGDTLDAGQRTAIIAFLEDEFATFKKEVRRTIDHDDLRMAIREGFLRLFDGLGPYMRDLQNRGKYGSLINAFVDLCDEGHIEDGADPIWCPSLKEWVNRPGDCPDILD